MHFESGAGNGEPTARWEHPNRPLRGLRLARLRRDQEAYRLTRAVGRSRKVSLRAMLANERGSAEAAAARQLAMYLIHVLLGRPQDVVGTLFGRHASTVSHACRVIEDLRDRPPLEAEIAAIETGLADSAEISDAA